MKQGKKPTKKQATLIKSRRLDPNNWLVITETNEMMMIRHRETNRMRPIYKENAI